MCESIDVAEADEAVEGPHGHEGVVGGHFPEGLHLQRLEFKDQVVSGDEVLHGLECAELRDVEIRIHQVSDDVHGEGRVDGPVHEGDRCGNVGCAYRNSYLGTADAVAALEHKHGLDVEVSQVEVGAVRADGAEVVGDLSEVRKVQGRDGRLDRKDQRHEFELDGHVFLEKSHEVLDHGDAHERHVCGAEDVEVALAA